MIWGGALEYHLETKLIDVRSHPRRPSGRRLPAGPPFGPHQSLRWISIVSVPESLSHSHHSHPQARGCGHSHPQPLPIAPTATLSHAPQPCGCGQHLPQPLTATHSHPQPPTATHSHSQPPTAMWLWWLWSVSHHSRIKVPVLWSSPLYHVQNLGKSLSPRDSHHSHVAMDGCGMAVGGCGRYWRQAHGC